MLIPEDLLRVISALRDNFTIAILLCGQEVATFSVTSGIKQGCPLSGTLFALALDPLVRRCLPRSVLDGLTVFADDMALAVACLRKQLAEILSLLAE